MQLNHVKNEVTMASGMAAPQAFSIAMNAKAFKVLSDTMYQDKIGSIVRELSCNAYDSHVMAGKPDTPFEIHIPDAFEPWFTVKDTGIGLTPDAMVTVFTKYFESTKDTSNDVIGAFGLGSKSWASYTDQANIVSITDGVKRSYSAFISSEGMPAILEIGSEPTTECNGVSITINSRKEDYKEFKDAIAKQLRFFTVKPIISNHPDFKFEKIDDDIEIQTNSIDVRKSRVSYGNNVFLIQGQVGYPLDNNIVNSKLSKTNPDAVSFLRDISNAGTVHLYFAIGEIEVTASREGVSYTDFTIANIAKKLAQAQADVSNEIKQKIDAFLVPWDMACYINSNPTVSKFAHASKLDLKGLTKIGNAYAFDGRKTCIDTTDPLKPRYKLRIFNYSHGAKGTVSTGFEITPREKTVVMIRDTGKQPVARIQEYLDKYNVNAVVFQESVVGSGLFTPAFVDELSKAYGEVEIMKVSELDITVKPRAPRTRGAYVKSTYYTFANSNTTSLRQWNKETNVLQDLKNPVLYSEIVDRNCDISNTTNLSRYVALINAKVIDMPLIAVRKDDIAKLPAGSVSFNSHIITLIDGLKGDPEVAEYFKLNELTECCNGTYKEIARLVKNDLSKITAPAFLEFAKAIDEIDTKYSKYSQRADIIAKANIIRGTTAIDVTKERLELTAKAENVRKIYSLVNALPHWNLQQNIAHIIIYLNSVGA